MYYDHIACTIFELLHNGNSTMYLIIHYSGAEVWLSNPTPTQHPPPPPPPPPPKKKKKKKRKEGKYTLYNYQTFVYVNIITFLYHAI